MKKIRIALLLWAGLMGGWISVFAPIDVRADDGDLPVISDREYDWLKKVHYELYGPAPIVVTKTGLKIVDTRNLAVKELKVKIDAMHDRLVNLYSVRGQVVFHHFTTSVTERTVRDRLGSHQEYTLIVGVSASVFSWQIKK